MHYIKGVLLTTLLLLAASCTTGEKAPPVDTAAEAKAVESVLKQYKDAIQNLTVEGTDTLFTKEAQVYESGGVEGTYGNYVAHHLGPELDHFNSFTFSDYKAEVAVNMPWAFTTETYVYTIDLKANPEKGRKAMVISRKGVATSILKKIDGRWKIIKTHTSARNAGKH